jgi:hypothetical protein
MEVRMWGWKIIAIRKCELHNKKKFGRFIFSGTLGPWPWRWRQCDVSKRRHGIRSQNNWFVCKAPYTLSVKLSDFTLWGHTYRKNWVNCAVLTGNRAGLINVLSIRLSHTELRSSLRESHSFLSLPADTTVTSSEGTQQTWQKTDKPNGKPMLCQRTFSSVFRAVVLYS